MSENGGESLNVKMSQVSAFSTSSVRDLLSDSCCLNKDDDEGTLNLVTRFTYSYLVHSTLEQPNDPGSDSDSSAESDSEPEPAEIPFDVRPEDQILDKDISRFRDRGCGCHLDDGKIKLFFVGFFIFCSRLWCVICDFCIKTLTKQLQKITFDHGIQRNVFCIITK